MPFIAGSGRLEVKEHRQEVDSMDFRELLLIQHARIHAAEVGRPDLSSQDLVLRDMTDEQMLGHSNLTWGECYVIRGLLGLPTI